MLSLIEPTSLYLGTARASSSSISGGFDKRHTSKGRSREDYVIVTKNSHGSGYDRPSSGYLIVQNAKLLVIVCILSVYS